MTIMVQIVDTCAAWLSGRDFFFNRIAYVSNNLHVLQVVAMIVH